MERFMRQTQDLFEKVADKPLTVDHVRVEARGGPPGEPAPPLRTRQDILERELQRVYDARSLREVHAAVEEAVEHLRQLEAFRRIDALIDDAPAGVDDVCSVLLELQERGWYSGGVQTFMQGNEGLLQGHVSLRNLSGACEQWRLTGEYGHRKSFDFGLLWRLPRAGGGDWTPDVSVFRRSTNLELYSSFADTMRGLELGVTSADGMRRLSYGWGWRSQVAGASASKAVRAQRGDFLHDALRWTYVLDERDSSVVHTEGWGARLVSELGGLYPGARFRYAKQRLDWVWAAPLSGSVALNVALGTGLMFPLSSPPSTSGRGSSAGGGTPSPRDPAAPPSAAAPPPATCLAERFFLGGCDSVRGFAYRGLGPSAERRGGGGGGGDGSGGEQERDALGGDLFGTIYAGLVARLPGQLGDLGGCAHAFVNGGSASLLSGLARGGGGSGGGGEGGGALAELGSAARRRLGDVAASLRWSAGVGLVLPTPFGRFEANYVWVVSSQPGDVPKAGLQFGFAASPIAPTGPS